MTAPNIFSTLVIWTAVLLCARSPVLCAPLCLTGDFDSQLRHILHEQMLSTQETVDIISQVLHDVRATLNQRWQGYEVFVCGSLSTGLGTKSSDVDLAIRLPNFNSSAGLYVLQETKKLFKKQPTVYSRLRYKYNVELKFIFSLFRFLHIALKREAEIQYDTGDISVANSKLVKYYFELDKRSLPLGGILKYWFGIHGVAHNGKRSLRNYALYLLTIFYLQQKNMAPPGYVLQVDAQSHITSDSWDVGFNELPYRSENTDSLHQLLGGFFKYYSEFDFENYIVSPFTGRPIPKNAFKDIDNFPKEYTLNNNTLTKRLDVKKYWSSSTDISIQDVFVHDSNSGEELSHELATKFKYLMKSAAKMFADLPRDSVLGAILVADQHEGTVVNHNNTTVEGIHEQDCIDISQI